MSDTEALDAVAPSAAPDPVPPPGRRRIRAFALGGCLLVIAAIAVQVARDTSFNYDEFYFLEAAKNLALRGEYATVSNGQVNVFDPYISTGPTLIAPIAAAFWLWRPGYFAGRLVMVVFFIALFVLVYSVASELHGRLAGFLACFFLLCVPLLWFMGLHVLGEIPALVFFLAGVRVLLQAERSTHPTRLYLLVGLFLGLAALTKLIFFLGIAALGGLAVLLALRNLRRAAGLVGGVIVALAMLAIWEILQRVAAGPERYAELKQDFYHMFVRESGVLAWVSQGGRNLLDDTVATAGTNLRAIGLETGWALSLAVVGLMVFVLVEAARHATARRHAAVHVFLGLFFVAYALWFFFTSHNPFFRFFVPVYLLFGIYLAPALVEAVATLARPVSMLRKVLIAMVAAAVIFALLITPFVRNAIDLVKVFREQPARVSLRLVKVLTEKVPADAKIGYWGWWRAPEISFFMPNRFVDMSLPPQRVAFDPDRDFILATATQKRLDPLSWELQRRFCREELVVRGKNSLCRFGDGSVPIPPAPSLRLDFMTTGGAREDQLSDGFYHVQEAPPRWVASAARFVIGTTGKTGRLRLVFDVPGYLGPSEPKPVTVTVLVNDGVVGRYQFTAPGQKTLTTDCVAPNPATNHAVVELTTDRAFVPRQLRINRDSRVLALQLRDVEFIPEQPCAAGRS